MPFAAAVDATFEHLGADGSYTPQGGAAVTVRVIFKEPTETASNLKSTKYVFVAMPYPVRTILNEGLNEGLNRGSAR